MPRKKRTPEPPKGFEPLTPLDPSYGAFQAGPVPLTVPPQCLPSNEGEGTDSRQGSHDTHSTPDNTHTASTTDDTQAQSEGKGDTLPTAVSSDESPTETACTREERPSFAVVGRLCREGRWKEVSGMRDQMMIEARARGMTKLEAQLWTYAELERLYPPLPPKDSPVETASAPVETPADAQVPGLYLVPEAWPALSDNASLQAELGWVQSQRLAIIEERGNQTIVRLERASCPAPSKAALGWLETSIRSYAKYVDVCARVLAGGQDEADSVRRERMRLDEIRALLDDMHKGE